MPRLCSPQRVLKPEVPGEESSDSEDCSERSSDSESPDIDYGDETIRVVYLLVKRCKFYKRPASSLPNSPRAGSPRAQPASAINDLQKRLVRLGVHSEPNSPRPSFAEVQLRNAVEYLSDTRLKLFLHTTRGAKSLEQEFARFTRLAPKQTFYMDMRLVKISVNTETPETSRQILYETSEAPLCAPHTYRKPLESPRPDRDLDPQTLLDAAKEFLKMRERAQRTGSSPPPL